MANAKVKCEVCGKYEGHVLVTHIKEKHGLTASEYVEKYDAPVASEYGFRKLKIALNDPSNLPARDRTTVEVSKLFGIESDDTVEVFEGSDPNVFPCNPLYVFPAVETHLLLMALALPKRNRALIVGPSGSGKSELAVNTTSKLNWPATRINLDDGCSRSELVGQFIVEAGKMVWRDGKILTAMRRGYVLIVDEFDMMNPRAAAIFRPVFEDPSRMVVLETGEVVTAHPDFRVIATGNTWGRGDETGLYGSTNVLAEADLQRFSIFIELDYPDSDTEKKIVKREFTDLQDTDVGAFVSVAGDIRSAFKAGTLDRSMSPRQLLNWIEKYTLLGDVMVAARTAFLNPLPPDQRTAVEEYVQRAFGVAKS